MIPQPPLHADGEVWICSPCQMIGTRDQAQEHARATGHAIEQVPDDVAAQVREERVRQHDQFAAALIGAARGGFIPRTTPEQGSGD